MERNNDRRCIDDRWIRLGLTGCDMTQIKGLDLRDHRNLKRSRLSYKFAKPKGINESIGGTISM